MEQSYAGAKGRRKKRRVYAVHHDVIRHPIWIQMSPYAKLLWYELGFEYNTANNGWLACPYNFLINDRGFGSRSTIIESFKELIWYGFIEQTYPGSMNKEPSRYLLTHLDVSQHPSNMVMARKASHSYKKHNGEKFQKRSRHKKVIGTVGDISGAPNVPDKRFGKIIGAPCEPEKN